MRGADEQPGSMFSYVSLDPLRALKGFSRVRLAPGQRRTVTFTLSDRDVSLVTPDGVRVVSPGRLAVFVGGGQPGRPASGLRAGVELTGPERVLPR